MGFRAPSAEEVYRYVFRVGEVDRSLTDRFGFSIIFVNDSSPICGEFLRSYFVDLCYRTADRIRFVFFADLPEDEITSAAQRTRYFDTDGLLGWLLRRATGGSRFERMYAKYESWEDLLPRGLRPAHPENTRDRLGWERDSCSAVPGLGESLRFAQRLGIGRHVPCLVLFTDVGSRHIDIMPIERGMSADTVYQHVRRWIDDYYEQNRERIEAWELIERDIQTLRSELDVSLREIKRWGDRNVEAWRTLRTCNEAIGKIQKLAADQPVSWAASVLLLQQLRLLPDAFKASLQRFKETLVRLSVRQGAGETAERYYSRLQNANDFATTFDALQGLGSCGVLSNDWMARMRDRLNHYRDSEPELAVLTWWAKIFKAQPSFEEYRRYRVACDSRKEEALRVRREEYQRFLAMIRELPFAVNPSESAARVLMDLGREWGEVSDAESAPAQLQRSVEHYLTQVVSGAPRWLSGGISSLRIRDAIAWKGGAPGRKAFEALPAEHPIRDLVSREQRERSTALRHLQEENDQFAAECKAAVLSSVRESVAECQISHDAWRRSLGAALAELMDVRANVEAETYESADALLTTKSKAGDEAKVKRLQEAIEAYQEVCAAMTLPYKADPFVQTIDTLRSVAVAAKVDEGIPYRATVGARGESEVKRSESVDLNDAATPSLLLSRAMDAVLKQETSTELRQAVFESAPGKSIPRLSANAGQVLAGLGLRELEKVAAEVFRGSGKSRPANIGTDELVGLVLEEIGADAAKYRAERDPVLMLPSSYEYDVFLAYNGADKTEAEALGVELKRAGLKVWLDEWELPPGRVFQEEIERVLPRTRAVAVLVGPAGIGPWERLELRAAISQCVRRGAPVIPVLLAGASNEPKLPLLLREFSWVRFSQAPTTDSAAVKKLVWGIKGGTGEAVVHR